MGGFNRRMFCRTLALASLGLLACQFENPLGEKMNYLAASIGVLISFIPIRFAIGISSTYKSQCVSLLKFESH